MTRHPIGRAQVTQPAAQAVQAAGFVGVEQGTDPQRRAEWAQQQTPSSRVLRKVVNAQQVIREIVFGQHDVEPCRRTGVRPAADRRAGYRRAADRVEGMVDGVEGGLSLIHI